jgi:tetratricopeptide (TPR) repeat protein
MAALNASGFDAEADSPNNHPLRRAVREELAKREIPSREAIRAFIKQHQRKNDVEDLTQYISFALATAGPPDFGFKTRDVEIPPEAAALREFAPLLAAFYKEAGIEDLWTQAQPAIDHYIARYHQPVLNTVLEANSYLRNVQEESYMGRRFQIYIELLAPPNQVQTRSYGNEYYVVVTPSQQIRIDEIRHSYLFFLLDPLTTRSAEVLNRKRGLIDHAQRAPALAEMYKEDFLLLATASAVKAVEARLLRRPEMVAAALEQGFILAPYFWEQLPAYEQQEASMRFYYPELAKLIDLRKEDARLSKVEFASRTPARVVTPAAPSEPVPTGAEKTLEAAERAYAGREMARAREAFMQVLRETGDPPLQARAFYGLARIAVLEKNPELAERLFLRTIQSSPDPQVKAWTHVYLGRLADAAGEREQAVQHYQDALKVDGASEGARRAAEQGVQQSFSKQER